MARKPANPAPATDRASVVRARTIELMTEGMDPVDAALQAEREHPEAVETLLKIDVELKPRDMAFVREVCVNDEQVKTLIRKLVARARLDWKLISAEYGEPEKGKAKTLPREHFQQVVPNA